jgi:NitT/TauT family transport system substrate-binding protein
MFHLSGLLRSLAILATGLVLTVSFASAVQAAGTVVTMANPVVVNSAAEVWTFAPEGFGFFAKEGLEVQNLFNNGGAVSFGQVASGQADFGESSLENVINAIQAGEPIHPFAALITTSVWAIGVLDSSPIRSYSQLAGKVIGVSSLTSGAYPFAQEVVANNQLVGKIKYAVAGTGGPAAEALSGGQVDAMVTTDQEWVTLAHLGVKIRFLPAPVIGSYPSDMLFTSDKFYQEHKDLVVKFAAAVFAGISQAQAHNTDAVKHFEELNRNVARSVPTDVSLDLLKARLSHLRLRPAQQRRWGYLVLDDYAKVQSLGLQYGSIKAPGINVKAIFSNDLVPAINAEVSRLLKS